MIHTDHPQESIPAYVLGALDADEALRVRAHLAVCDDCRAEADSFHAVVSMLPYAADAHSPPPRVKRQLLARIDAAREPAAPPEQRRVPPLRAAPRWPQRLAGVAAVVLLAAVASLGYVVLDTRAQAQRLAAQLEQSQQELGALREQLGRDAQLVAFIGQPATLVQPLPPTARAPGASAQMYMQPGDTEVALVVHGLPPLAPGKIYRLWLASGSELVPVGTLESAAGLTQFHGHAPASLDTYAQVMVTVDDASQAPVPGGEVMFETNL